MDTRQKGSAHSWRIGSLKTLGTTRASSFSETRGFAALLRMRTVYSAFAALILVALILAAIPVQAHAQDAYPNKPITMIIPFAAGGSTDVIGRLVAEGLRQVLGQPVIAGNRPAAGRWIGSGAITNAAPRGSTS